MATRRHHYPSRWPARVSTTNPPADVAAADCRQNPSLPLIPSIVLRPPIRLHLDQIAQPPPDGVGTPSGFVEFFLFFFLVAMLQLRSGALLFLLGESLTPQTSVTSTIAYPLNQGGWEGGSAIIFHCLETT